MLERFLRHIAACNNADLPGERLPFLLCGSVVGWVKPDFAEALALHGFVRSDGAVRLDDPHRLQPAARELAEEGWYSWRDEAFDVRANWDGPVLATLDRGALPLFGVEAAGVHLNGLVHRPDGLHLWVGRRAADKQLDPGKLDHLVGGGVPAGLSPAETLVKEGAEEAGLSPELLTAARQVGIISYRMERPEGLRRDRLWCYDLELPESFMPVPQDGEVEAFELWPLARVFETVRDGDSFKFNVNLVLIDLFLRVGLIDPQSPGGRQLRAGLQADGAALRAAQISESPAARP
jgi:8-oxo-dGTP pyrophosphatase MutT (NUDIX family)